MVLNHRVSTLFYFNRSLVFNKLAFSLKTWNEESREIAIYSKSLEDKLSTVLAETQSEKVKTFKTKLFDLQKYFNTHVF